MARFTRGELTRKALAALEAALRRAVLDPGRPAAVDFALAWLANDCPHREPFDNFWQALAIGERDERIRKAHLALETIYLLKRVERPEQYRECLARTVDRRHRKMRI